MGNWSVNETELKLSYEVTIVIDSSSSTKVKIINFANAGSGSAPAIAVVSGNTITLVSNQVIGDGWKSMGAAHLRSGKITWAYTLFDGANLHSLSAIYSPF